MSSIDARKLLMDGQGHLVDHWVSCMGIPSAKTSIGTILGGIDVIGNYKMGIQTGIGAMLGYLIDFDTMAKDLIEHKYAYLTDSRSDMSKIPHPVLWIYGTHDKWSNGSEVQDIMGIKSKGKREVIEIPTGHNLRSSADAIATFKLITGYLYEKLYGETLDVVEPNKEEMIRLIASERERLELKDQLNREQYWKNYLLGAGKNSLGYDFYGMIKEFREFVTLEAELLNPQPADRIGDLGCGTGLLTEALLHRLNESDSFNQAVEIVAVDLVEDALEHTREKWEAYCNQHPHLKTHTLQLHRLDLEPNRLIPVQRLINDPDSNLDFLRNRIPGLQNATIDLLKQKSSAALTEILKGCDITEEKQRVLETTLEDRHRSAVIDFNRAARFLKHRLQTSDLIRPTHSCELEIPQNSYQTLNCNDIRFEVLDLGNALHSGPHAFPDMHFDKIAASLFISYVHNPDLILLDFYRMLKPAGLLLVSSMKPDSDISTIFTDYVNTVQSSNVTSGNGRKCHQNLDAARAMLNEAAALFTLEEDGYFRFFSEKELAAMLEAAGFQEIHTYRSLGDPAQAIILTGKKPQ
jgi:ubiquinone/menaquinone biosynthesis C-methylase UbiE